MFLKTFLDTILADREQEPMHLGDGAYGCTRPSFGDVVVFTERDDGVHWIALDRSALEVLANVVVKRWLPL